MIRRKRLLLIPALGMAAMLASVMPSSASSHREAPLISQDPVADTTDVYAFVSPDHPDTATLIANWIPLEEPAGGPNFYRFGDDVRYLINIDNNGDAVDDIVYEFRFTTQVQNPNTFLYNTGPIKSLNDPNFNVRQYYSVAVIQHGKRTVLGTGLATPPNNIGPRSTPNYFALGAAAVHTLPGGIKVFAGQRDDPFFVDLGSAFDLGGLRPLNPAHVLPMPAARGKDGLSGYNVHSIALQVPIKDLTFDGKAPTGPNDPRAVIGVYSETQRRQTRVLSKTGGQPMESGDWVNVSRLGMPLVNEVVVPLGSKDHFNASEPEDDAQFLPAVQDPEFARLIPKLYPGVTVPAAPRNDIITIFLTGIPGLNQPPHVKPSEMIRLNLAIPPVPLDMSAPFSNENHLGVIGGDNAGFPNGRRLADDVTDIELRALAGGTPLTPAFNHSPNNILGDGVNGNDRPFLGSFPYEANPWQGYSRIHRDDGGFNTCC
jgi:hypothetical protein